MYPSRRAALIGTLIVMSAGLRITNAQSADPPREAPFHFGPVTLAPVIDGYLGHDNNLFNRSDGDATREGDITGAISPTVDAWLRSGYARAAGRGRADIYYYRTFDDLRALDWTAQGRLDVPINRVRPFGALGFSSTTNSQNLEIDTIARRTTGSVQLGGGVRLTPRVEVELSYQRSRLSYDEKPLFGDANLADELDYTSNGGALAVLYTVTPLTTVGVQALLSRDRFDVSSERDSDNAYILPFVEFKPTALISGRASIGIQSRKVLSGASPDFTGTVISAELGYTLLGQTRFIGSISRNLQYSYIEGRTDYVEGILGLRVVHRLNDSWDVGGSVSRARHSYSGTTQAGSDTAVTYPDETFMSYGTDVGYRFRRTRVGFRIDYYSRDAVSDPFRNFDRTRAYSSFTYTF